MPLGQRWPSVAVFAPPVSLHQLRAPTSNCLPSNCVLSLQLAPFSRCVPCQLGALSANSIFRSRSEQKGVGEVSPSKVRQNFGKKCSAQLGKKCSASKRGKFAQGHSELSHTWPKYFGQ